MGIAAGGGGGIDTALAILQLDELQLGAADPTGIQTLSAEARVRLLEQTIKGVDIPDYKRAQETLRAMLFRNGTTPEVEAATMNDMKEGTIVEDFADAGELTNRMNFLNDPVTKARVKQSSSAGDIKVISANVAQSIADILSDVTTDLPFTYKVATDGSIQVFENGKPVKSSVARSYNTFIKTYADVIDIEGLKKILEGNKEDGTDQ